MHQFFRGHSRLYLIAFFTGFSSLVIELAITRALSVVTYYYLAFFSVSVAMLGMTAGAITVFLKPHFFAGDGLIKNLSFTSLLFSFSAIVTAFALCLMPVGLEMSFMKLAALLLLTFFCALPFYFAGIIITSLLTKASLPVNKLYAADLIGAGLGCLFLLALLNYMDAISIIIFSGIFGIVCWYLFSEQSVAKKQKKTALVLAGLIVLLSSLNFFTGNGIRPLVVKGNIENPQNHLLEKWNSFSKIVVLKEQTKSPQLWGSSIKLPPQNLAQFKMTIDGDAGTVLRKFSSVADINHLQYDLTALAYHLRPPVNTCIIGVGGGKDVQTALLFGSKKITGVELNPVFIQLLNGRFANFSGIGNNPSVNLVVDEARSFLSHSKEKYNLIQMSLVDTWAATGAGAFSLSENNLYTIEAWQVFINRLSNDGLFTVSRWYNPTNLGETGRLVSLATAALFRSGIKQPQKHLALATVNNLATLILSKQPFANKDVLHLQQTTDSLQFNLVLSPHELPAHALLQTIVSATSENDLEKKLKPYPVNYLSPTDESPYFFNMLRLGHLNTGLFKKEGGVMHGNLQASITLLLLILCLLIVAIGAIILPLVRGPGLLQKHATAHRSALAYFSILGAGFMLVEIAAMQRLSVFLGHPVYALGILLMTIIISTGIGSLSSEKCMRLMKMRPAFYPFIAVALIIITGLWLIPVVTKTMIEEAMEVKIFLSIILIFPLGFCLGWFFPLGMKLTSSFKQQQPWYWALNGIFGVLFSALAVLISIYGSISMNFIAAAFLYGILPFLIRKMGSAKNLQ